MGIETAALIVAGVAAGATAYNTYETNKKTEREAVAAIEGQRKRDEQASNEINQTTAALRASTPEAEKQAAIGSYVDTIREGQSAANEGLWSPGAVSDRFTKAASGAAGDIAADATKRAGQLATIDAARNQRVREGISFNNLGERLGNVARGAGADAFLSDLRMKKAARRDPWLDALGSAGSAYASSGGSYEPQTAFGPGVI